MKKLIPSLFCITATALMMFTISSCKDNSDTATVWKVTTDVWKCTQDDIDEGNCDTIGEYKTDTYPLLANSADFDNDGTDEYIYTDTYITPDFDFFLGVNIIDNGSKTGNRAYTVFNCEDLYIPVTHIYYNSWNINSRSENVTVSGNTITVTDISDSNMYTVFTKTEVTANGDCSVFDDDKAGRADPEKNFRLLLNQRNDFEI